MNYVDPTGYWTVLKRNNSFIINGGLVIPKFEPNKWNSAKTKNATNCYAYALNILGLFPNGYSLDPGELSNKIYMDYFSRYTDRQRKLADQVIQAATADLKRLGHKLVPDSKLLRGGYRVALVTSIVDYHWYRDDGNNSWSHKFGHNKVSRYDTNNKLIKDPKNASRKFTRYSYDNYSYFAGYFRII